MIKFYSFAETLPSVRTAYPGSETLCQVAEPTSRYVGTIRTSYIDPNSGGIVHFYSTDFVWNGALVTAWHNIAPIQETGWKNLNYHHRECNATKWVWSDLATEMLRKIDDLIFPIEIVHTFDELASPMDFQQKYDNSSARRTYVQCKPISFDIAKRHYQSILEAEDEREQWKDPISGVYCVTPNDICRLETLGDLPTGINESSPPPSDALIAVVGYPGPIGSPDLLTKKYYHSRGKINPFAFQMSYIPCRKSISCGKILSNSTGALVAYNATTLRRNSGSIVLSEVGPFAIHTTSPTDFSMGTSANYNLGICLNKVSCLVHP
eukprot:NODE_4500_length_1158_cov_49.004831_g3982_i0.p1 GENE.NODE_4500_length_1158_cov_49.004831_g3982_i0~~NODE_4500_length_1158_cov_49.004831_g3982_i0.p1  ORF type:complete len:348 (-),score=48.01 NODE_4500_length_1158_cov_49.004831_g3982_i0:113-1078(-)